MRINLSVLLLFVSLCGCVSVNIGGKKGQKSEDVKYRAPSSPFQSLQSDGADHAWLNKSNGNSIAFHSSCNDPADPPLEAVQAEILSAFEDTKILKSENKTFNGREALNTEAEGAVDGVKTKTELMIFKKNSCVYSLSYVGVVKHFTEDQAKFRDFMASFEAP